MATQMKRIGDAALTAQCAEADRIRDRAEELEAAMTRRMIGLLGGSSIWERAARGGVIPLV